MANSTNFLRFSSISLALKRGENGGEILLNRNSIGQIQFIVNVQKDLLRAENRECEPQNAAVLEAKKGNSCLLVNMAHPHVKNVAQKSIGRRLWGPLGVQKGGSDVPGTLGKNEKKKRRNKNKNPMANPSQNPKPTEKQISNSDATIYIVHSHCCRRSDDRVFIFISFSIFPKCVCVLSICV